MLATLAVDTAVVYKHTSDPVRVQNFSLINASSLFMNSSYECNAVYGLGAKLRYMDYFESLLHPREGKFCCYLESGTLLVGLQIHVLLSYLWSFFCNWLVINVSLVTLKNEVYKIQDQYCFVKPYK